MGINFLQINTVMKLESKGESFSKTFSSAEYIRLSKIYLFKFKIFFFASSQWANWAIKCSLARVSFLHIYIHYLTHEFLVSKNIRKIWKRKD